MLRRKISLLVLAAAALALAACADPTAPKPKLSCINQQGAGICT